MLVTDFRFLDIFDYVPGLPELPVERLFESSLEHGGHRCVAQSGNNFPHFKRCHTGRGNS